MKYQIIKYKSEFYVNWICAHIPYDLFLNHCGNWFQRGSGTAGVWTNRSDAKDALRKAKGVNCREHSTEN